MKWFLFSLVLGWFAVALANDFVLVNSEGKEYGPFSYRQGTKISVGGEVLEIKKLDKAEIRKDWMKEIIIPELQFRQASVVDVLDFIFETSGIKKSKFEPFKPSLDLESEKNVEAGFGPPDEYDEGYKWFHGESDHIAVTLNLRRVSLYDTLKFVCELTNLGFEILGDDIRIYKLCP